jgi:hypothetical protein
MVIAPGLLLGSSSHTDLKLVLDATNLSPKRTWDTSKVEVKGSAWGVKAPTKPPTALGFLPRALRSNSSSPSRGRATSEPRSMVGSGSRERAPEELLVVIP